MSNQIPRVGNDSDPDRVRRAMNALRGSKYHYSVPAEGTVASLRTLTAASSAADVRSFLITLVRDLQAEGKLS